MQTHINVVAVFGLIGLLLGLAGDRSALIGGCILIGASLIAKAIHYRGRD